MKSIIEEIEIAKSDIILILSDVPETVTEETINEIGEKIINRLDEIINRYEE